MSDKLRLNTLHRFAKHSERLLVQEYSHCEVPAGCGGYIVRWTDPAAGVPILFQVACPGRAEGFIDGRPMESGRVTLRAGEHVLAVHVSGLSSFPAPLVLTATPDRPWTPGSTEAPLLRSAADGTWRATTRDPAGAWVEPVFDDAEWRALSDLTLTAENTGGDRWSYDRLTEGGAVALRLDAPEVWIRKRFSVEDR